MFTGIVESLGTVHTVTLTDQGCRLTFDVGDLAVGLSIGDSIAVNGVCLTAVDVSTTSVSADVVSETINRTNLGSLEAGDQVNLERPMRADGRFDGHIVQGHVDATGGVARVEPEGEGTRVTIVVPESYRRYLVEKGSVTVDGVSLTLAAVIQGGFEVALIPHTLTVTTLGLRRPGDVVNLEFDVLAKYVERLLETRP
jgi:riboflavin synthase